MLLTTTTHMRRPTGPEVLLEDSETEFQTKTEEIWLGDRRTPGGEWEDLVNAGYISEKKNSGENIDGYRS